MGASMRRALTPYLGKFMPYHLRDGLSFCFIDGHPIFLDLQNDRYFMLPSELERAFCSYVQEDEPPPASISALLDRDILSTTEPQPHSNAAAAIAPAIRSAMEEQQWACELSTRTYLEVLSFVCWVWIRLRMTSLDRILNDLSMYRAGKTAATEMSTIIEADVVAASNQFRHTRSLIPVRTSCLLDSLSLAYYLANRRLPTSIVFGVARSPFSAHCWTQFRDVVLNETITDVNTHTRILVW